MKNIAKNSITLIKIVIGIIAITIYLLFAGLISVTVLAVEVSIVVIALALAPAVKMILSIFEKKKK